MIVLTISKNENVIDKVQTDKDVVLIGRSRTQDVCLNDIAISREAAKIIRAGANGESFVLKVGNGSNDVIVNNVRVNESCVLSNGDVIIIKPFQLLFTIILIEKVEIKTSYNPFKNAANLNSQASFRNNENESTEEKYQELNGKDLKLDARSYPANSDENISHKEEMAGTGFQIDQNIKQNQTEQEVVYDIKDNPVEQQEEIFDNQEKEDSQITAYEDSLIMPNENEEIITLKANEKNRFESENTSKLNSRVPFGLLKKLYEALGRKLEEKRYTLHKNADKSEEMKVRQLCLELLTEEQIPPNIEKQAIIDELIDYRLKFGPMQRYLNDPGINEIMVNAYNKIFVERKGGRYPEKVPEMFIDERHLKLIIDRIIAPREVTSLNPYVDSRTVEGYRINAVIPPAAVRGCSLTIRKFSKQKLSIDHLISAETLDDRLAKFLCFAVACRQNIIISGGTGSGKTTLLNVLADYINDNERIVTIEDAAELRIAKEHVVSLEAQATNNEGKGCITIRELVRNSLRMRPDRIVVGECRDEAALDMLQAMSTGHDGSLSTVHANSAIDAMSRLEVLIQFANTRLTLQAIRKLICTAVNIVIQIQRFADGKRKIVQVVEIPDNLESGEITPEEIFMFESDKNINDSSGKWKAVACPQFVRKAGDEEILSLFKGSRL